MSEQEDPTVTVSAPVSEAAFLELQRIHSGAQERIEKHRIDANKEVALAQGPENRRMIALNCALASYGVGHQSFNPPAQKPDTDAVLTRATCFEAFLRGEPAHSAVVVPIETPPAA